MSILTIVKKYYWLLRGERPVESLRKFGATVGEGCVSFKLTVNKYDCPFVSIGSQVVFAPEVMILAHDASTRRRVGFTKIDRVRIGDRTFVGARSIILPGSEIGDDCIIGAGSVVRGRIPTGEVWAGSPAVKLGSTGDLVERNIARSTHEPRLAPGWKTQVVDFRRGSAMAERIQSRGWAD